MKKVRITKDPQERKDEIVEASEAIFMEKGYDNTSVSDIVKSIEVAQGTFYYYFESKEDVLNAISRKYVRLMADLLREIDEREDLDAVGKISLFFNMTLSFAKERESITGTLHEESNLHLHHKIETVAAEKLLPIFVKMIKQGIDEGTFTTEYPEESGMMIFEVSARLFDHETLTSILKGDRPRRLDAAVDIIERMLGTQRGTFGGIGPSGRKEDEQ